MSDDQPNDNGMYSEALNEKKNYKVEIFHRDCGMCRVCGDFATEIHHITSDGGDTLDNCISLCEMCKIQASKNHKGFKSDQLLKIIRNN